MSGVRRDLQNSFFCFLPQVCRQAGYYKHAVYLAEKFEQHDWCVGDIQTEKRGGGGGGRGVKEVWKEGVVTHWKEKASLLGGGGREG